MPVTIREAREGDAPESIIYAAFATIAAEHNFPRDFPSAEIAGSRVRNYGGRRLIRSA
jgi:hypothetical protein